MRRLLVKAGYFVQRFINALRNEPFTNVSLCSRQEWCRDTVEPFACALNCFQEEEIIFRLVKFDGGGFVSEERREQLFIVQFYSDIF